MVFYNKTIPLGPPGHCEKRFCLDGHIRLVILIQRFLSTVCVTAKLVLALSASSGNKLTDDADIAEHQPKLQNFLLMSVSSVRFVPQKRRQR